MKRILTALILMLVTGCGSQPEAATEPNAPLPLTATTAHTETPLPTATQTADLNNNNEENNSDISYYSEGTIELFSTFVDQGDSGTREGMIILENEEAFFDFDSGQIVNDSRADIYLFVGCGNKCSTSLIVINDAQGIWLVDENIILDYQRCKEELSTPYKDRGVMTSPGYYSCVLTNENRIVQLLILERETINVNGRVIFQYIVWP